MNQKHEHSENDNCPADNSLIWKMLTGVLAFVSMLCVTLAILPYNGLLKADDSQVKQIETMKAEVKQNTVQVIVHDSRIRNLEMISAERKMQLDNIERLLVKTATIVEGLGDKFNDLDHSVKRQVNKKTFGLTEEKTSDRN